MHSALRIKLPPENGLEKTSMTPRRTQILVGWVQVLSRLKTSGQDRFWLARSSLIASWLLMVYGSATPNFETMYLLYSFAMRNWIWIYLSILYQLNQKLSFIDLITIDSVGIKDRRNPLIVKKNLFVFVYIMQVETTERNVVYFYLLKFISLVLSSHQYMSTGLIIIILIL